MNQIAVKNEIITRRMLKAAVLAPVLSMIFLIAVLGFLVFKLIAARASIEQTDLVIAQAYKTQKLMLDCETGLRGYFLTKSPVFLEPYESSLRMLPAAFANLKQVLRDDPDDLAIAAMVESTSLEWLKFSEESLVKQRASAPDYLAKVRAGEGKRRMDRIRKLIDRLVSHQEEIKSIRNRSMNSTLYFLCSMGIGIFVFIAGFLTFTARRAFAQILKVYSGALNEENQKSAQRVRAGEVRFRLYTETMPQMAFIADKEGQVVYYNQRWYDYVGIEHTEGWGWKPILPPEDVQKTVDRWTHSLKTGEPYEMEYRLRRVDGEFRWHLGWALPVRDEQGEITHWLGTNTDIQDQKLAVLEFRRAKEAAEKAHQIKSNFLANMSHEMRTPLGIMIGSVELMQPALEEFPEGLHLLSMMERNSRRLYELINDLLDMSKVEADALHVDIARFKTQELIDDLSAGLQTKAARKGLEFSMTMDASVPEELASDLFRLRQILMNLIGNAIKFTERGSVKVTIRANVEEGSLAKNRIEFTIKDTGIGLTSEQQINIFKPFAQADGTINRKHGGTGLGLVLARRYAQALGGDVELLPGTKGCTFRTWIVNQIPSAKQIGPGVEGEKFFSAPDQKKSRILEGLRILIVDDSEDNRFLIGHFLQPEGARIEMAENGLRAVEKCMREDFDVVLMDLQMPVMNGREAASALRKNGFENQIIALTAHAMKGDREMSLSQGFNDYLTKPIDRGGLVRRLSEIKSSSVNINN